MPAHRSTNGNTSGESKNASIYGSNYRSVYKTGMITMLSNSLIEELNVSRRTRDIAMNVVSADSFRSLV
jgi:hypothetical protein